MPKLSVSKLPIQQGYPINPYIWCVVGAAVGWLAGMLSKTGNRVVIIENVLVAVFGAFIGGDFVAAQFNGGVVNDTVFSMRSLGLAVGGAVLMLMALGLMRRMVGPLRNSKSRAQKR